MQRYHIGRFDESQFVVPHGHERHSHGYEHASLIDGALGSVHMAAGIGRLQPAGHIAMRMHANEKGIYVLEGKLDVRRGKEVFRLAADDYALIPYGTPHAIRNPGAQAVLWFEMQAPQPKPPGNWQDTFFMADGDWPEEASAPDFGHGTTKSVGRFKPQNPMRPEGDGVRGLHVYRFMERQFGAQQFYMMRGELALGGYRSRHDHTVEEFYIGMSGEAFMDIESERIHLRRWDVAWTGVGASHAFTQTGDAPFRWIETQAPQFPAQGGTRNYSDWEKLRPASARG